MMSIWRQLRVLVLVSGALSSFSSAGWASCSGLKEELRAMRTAQAQIMQSLVSNHETFADSLENYASILTTDIKASKITAQKMNKTAQAFRIRGVQGKQIAEKLQQATNELAAKIANCL